MNLLFEWLNSLKMKQFLNFFILFLSIILTIVVVELSVRLYDIISPVPATSWKEFRLSKPAPYKHAVYNIDKIIDEAQHVGWTTGPDFGFLPNDFSGEYINIYKGYRKTPDIEASPKRRVWFFGGSTVICFEVPDGLTVPSYFSAFAKSTFGNSLQVINAGATTITIQHQVYRLRNMIDLKQRDIVIFMDGVNDVIQTLYFQNPTGTMIQHNREQIDSAGWMSKNILLVYEKLGPYSAVVRRFINPFKPSYLSVKVSDELLARLEDDYFTSIKAADYFVKSKRGLFFHFLQPNMFTVKRLTSYEKGLLENGYLVPPSIGDVYRKGYERLRMASDRANKIGIFSFDISDAFDQRRSEIFLDFAHVNEVGNEILAKDVFTKISAFLHN